jgi:hypothetical protein
MIQGAPDGWKVIGVFPSPYFGYFSHVGTFQLSAREGNHELFDFRTRNEELGTLTTFAHKLEIYDSKGNQIGGVSKNNITVGELKFQMGGGKLLGAKTFSFSFEKDTYNASTSNGAITLSRGGDGLVLAKFQELVYYGAKNGLGDILIRTEAFNSNLHVAIIAFIVWQIHARFKKSLDRFLA